LAYALHSGSTYIHSMSYAVHRWDWLPAAKPQVRLHVTTRILCHGPRATQAVYEAAKARAEHSEMSGKLAKVRGLGERYTGGLGQASPVQ
jgi:hypothetical protein